MGQKNATQSGTRTVHTFVLLAASARHALDAARDSKNAYDCLHCIVSTAFAIEAYLNHLGPQLFPCWETLQRLSARGKLELICEKVKVEPDYGIRPFQSFRDVFKARTAAAHGQTEELSYERRVRWGDHREAPAPMSRLEEYCNFATAERFLEDASSIMIRLQKAADLDTVELMVLGETRRVTRPDADAV